MENKKKVVVAFSGGLDTSYTVMYLAKEKGCKVIRLDTWEGNEPAKKMYPSLGYRLAGDTLFFFEQVIWETLVTYEKEIK